MNSIGTTFVIVLLVAGLIVGLSLAKTDLLNPWTSGALAERMAAETNHQEQMYKLEEQQKQAEYEAYLRQQKLLEQQQIQQAADDLAYQQKMNALELHGKAAFAEPGNLALMLISALMALGLVSLLIGFAIRLAHPVLPQSQAQAESGVVFPEQASLWDDPEYRAFAISLARQMEQAQYRKKLATPIQPKSVAMSPAPARHANGSCQYRDLPLAGD
jgi:hypothetical protein